MIDFITQEKQKIKNRMIKLIMCSLLKYVIIIVKVMWCDVCNVKIEHGIQAAETFIVLLALYNITCLFQEIKIWIFMNIIIIIY